LEEQSLREIAAIGRPRRLCPCGNWRGRERQCSTRESRKKVQKQEEKEAAETVLKAATQPGRIRSLLADLLQIGIPFPARIVLLTLLLQILPLPSQPDSHLSLPFDNFLVPKVTFRN
jgi:hypothetical protein